MERMAAGALSYEGSREWVRTRREWRRIMEMTQTLGMGVLA